MVSLISSFFDLEFKIEALLFLEEESSLDFRSFEFFKSLGLIGFLDLEVDDGCGGVKDPFSSIAEISFRDGDVGSVHERGGV